MSGRLIGATVLVASCVVATPARADQVFNVNIGYFALKSEDGRITDDVLNENLNLFAFDVSDFNSVALGGEWLLGLGDYVEVGVGAGFYRRTVPSVYADFVENDGSEIEQDFRLRIVPLTGTVRLFPTSRESALQPYVGGGVGLYTWRYSESGEFIDMRDRSIFRETYVAEGNDAGYILLGGLRAPVSPSVLVGGEFRYHGGEGEVGVENGFLADKIDLGGSVFQFTAGFRF